MAGNLVIGTAVMLASGTLNEIAAGFAIGVETAGLLVTAGAIVMGVGAPIAALPTTVTFPDSRYPLTYSVVGGALLTAAAAQISIPLGFTPVPVTGQTLAVLLVGAGKVSHKQAVAHAQSEYEQFAAQRRAALEAEGEAYAVRMLGASSADDGALEELGKVAKRLTKKKGGRDAA